MHRIFRCISEGCAQASRTRAKIRYLLFHSDTPFLWGVVSQQVTVSEIWDPKHDLSCSWNKPHPQGSLNTCTSFRLPRLTVPCLHYSTESRKSPDIPGWGWSPLITDNTLVMHCSCLLQTRNSSSFFTWLIYFHILDSNGVMQTSRLLSGREGAYCNQDMLFLDVNVHAK